MYKGEAKDIVSFTAKELRGLKTTATPEEIVIIDARLAEINKSYEDMPVFEHKVESKTLTGVVEKIEARTTGGVNAFVFFKKTIRNLTYDINNHKFGYDIVKESATIRIELTDAQLKASEIKAGDFCDVKFEFRVAGVTQYKDSDGTLKFHGESLKGGKVYASPQLPNYVSIDTYNKRKML